MIDFTSPWQRSDWIGDETLEQQVRSSIDQSAFSHGWIISGPSGIGKATLSYRIARAVLARETLSNDGTLNTDTHSQSAKLIASKAHPDLYVAERRWDEKKGRLETEITVDTIRSLTAFLQRTASFSEWRVAIIDKADELNRNAANALLKALEEPPRNTLILLVCEVPGRLIATIRSRCRRLDLRPLSEKTVCRFLETERAAEGSEAAAIAAVARGRPGYALELAAGEGGEAIAALDEFYKTAFGNGNSGVLIQSLTGKAGEQRWGIFKSLLLEAVTSAARSSAAEEENHSQMSAISIQDLARLSQELNTFLIRSEAVNLDRAQMIHTLLRKVKSAYLNKAA